MEKYEQISVVGEGSYGVVMKCRHRDSDQVVAVKKFLETEEDATIRKMALREIRMLKRLKHENLVTMIEVFRCRKRFYLVFEYLEGTVLDELEKIQGGLGDERSRERIFQVSRAISYCHSLHIIHRDVKPENVLVSSLGVVKLCDFGFARHISTSAEACTEYVATRWYRAPELLVGEPHYGPPVDIWAIGCLFAEMMTGDPIFPGDSDIDQLYLIVKMLGKPCQRHLNLMSKNSQLRGMIKSPHIENGLYKNFPSWSLQAIDFLSGCMKMDPHQRLTSEEILKHSYFTHDRFPQRFLPALREKVNIELNNPLLRKFKTEILMSTDKKDEIKPRRLSNEHRWKYNIQEGSMKRKLTSDGSDISLNDKNLITLSKTSQRLNLTTQKNQQLLSRQISKDRSAKNNIGICNQGIAQNGSNMSEMYMLEKSLESLAKFGQKTEDLRPASAEKEQIPSPLLPSSPLQFQSLTFTDFQKSPLKTTLHPTINNISFTKDPPKKSPNILNGLSNVKNVQGSLLGGHRSQFLKKIDRNVTMDNMFSSNNISNNNLGDANLGYTGPSWLTGLNTGPVKRKEVRTKDNFVLPNLPGVSNSPNNKLKKKSLPEIEVMHSNEVTPRLQSSTSHKTSPSKNSLL